MDEVVCHLYHERCHETGFEISGLIKVRAADDPVFHVDMMPCRKMSNKGTAEGTTVGSTDRSAVMLRNITLKLFQLVRNRCIAFGIRLIKAGIGNSSDQKIPSEIVYNTAEIAPPVAHCTGQEQNDWVRSVPEFVYLHS